MLAWLLGRVQIILGLILYPGISTRRRGGGRGEDQGGEGRGGDRDAFCPRD